MIELKKALKWENFKLTEISTLEVRILKRILDKALVFINRNQVRFK